MLQGAWKLLRPWPALFQNRAPPTGTLTETGRPAKAALRSCGDHTHHRKEHDYVAGTHTSARKRRLGSGVGAPFPTPAPTAAWAACTQGDSGGQKAPRGLPAELPGSPRRQEAWDMEPGSCSPGWDKNRTGVGGADGPPLGWVCVGVAAVTHTAPQGGQTVCGTDKCLTARGLGVRSRTDDNTLGGSATGKARKPRGAPPQPSPRAPHAHAQGQPPNQRLRQDAGLAPGHTVLFAGQRGDGQQPPRAVVVPARTARAGPSRPP